jgi:hypothetical protein
MPNGNFLKRFEILAIYALPVLWLISLMVLFNATSPLKSGPLSVLFAFVLIYLLVSSTLYMAVFSIMSILRLLSLAKPMSKRLVYYLVSVIALGPVFILALNTLGQLDPKDIVLVVVLLSLGCFYVVRRSAKPAA